MRTSNPVLTDRAFTFDTPAVTTMTIGGTVLKTAILLVLLGTAASITWAKALEGGANINLYVMGGAIGGLVLALITSFKPAVSPYTSPFYAVCEGLFLGAISAMFETAYPGIAFQAVGLTFFTLAALLVAYTSRLIKATENFKLGIVAATGGICLFYLVAMVLGFFGVQIPYLFGNGWMGIGFSVVVVTIAALNLVLDFDFIETGVARGAPKYMEWYGAFGLLVTLVWLYLEILKLLAKLRSRD
jgi:uncharacterized YccA/Bax inhibitor family protein